MTAEGQLKLYTGEPGKAARELMTEEVRGARVTGAWVPACV